MVGCDIMEPRSSKLYLLLWIRESFVMGRAIFDGRAWAIEIDGGAGWRG